MIRFIRTLACVTALAFALAGCSGGDKDTTTTTTSGATSATTGTGGSTTTGTPPATSANPMTGSWKLVLTPETIAKAPKDAKPPEMIFTFKDDNTFEASLAASGMNSKASGDYKLDGKKLTLTFKLEDGKPSKTPPATVDLASDMKSFPMPGGPAGQPAPGNIVKQ